jgi:chromosomal replication initiator protein
MELEQLWLKTCAVFRADVSEDVADTWLSQLQPVGIAGDQIFLTGSDRTRSWIDLRYRRVLCECVSSAAGADLQVQLVSTEEIPKGLQTGFGMALGTDFSASEPQFPNTPLNPRYTFEQFVIGTTNHMGHAASLAVAEQPAQAFNPLFIYGAPGVGKTHLLHAIGNYMGSRAPELNVRYMTAEDFASTFRSVIRDGSIGEFKEDLRSTDVLLIDDVQFLQNKLKTEEEFFHTFNALHESGRQLVISCDRTPRELEKVALRLRERFEAGLVVEIEPPDEKLRMTILRKRVQIDNIPINDESALDRIAERVPANIRSLEGALIRVSAFASMRRTPISAELVDELLDSLHPHATARVSVTQVQRAVANYYGLTVEELLSTGRERRLSMPRQMAMYLSCEMTRDTLPMIAAAFERDHSTVVHARDKLVKGFAEDPQVAAAADRLKRVIHSGGSDRAEA